VFHTGRARPSLLIGDVGLRLCDFLDVYRNYENKLQTAVLIAANSVLLAGCYTSGRVARQWENKVVRNERTQPNLGDARLDPKLTVLASEGWELVSRNADSWVFKRPKR